MAHEWRHPQGHVYDGYRRMIQKVDKTVTLQGKTEPILRFEVWFQTPFGLFTDLDEALRRVAGSGDLDPEMNVVPVSVAVCDTLYELCGH
jgi:hypothetical protein